MAIEPTRWSRASFGYLSSTQSIVDRDPADTGADISWRKAAVQENLSLGTNTALLLNGTGRIATVSQAGASANIAIAPASGISYGEAIELRYLVDYTASQFQGMLVRVQAASGVANTSTLRGAEYDARNASNQNAGVLTGMYGSATVKGTGTVTHAYGLDGNVALDADAAATVTNLAAVRGKVQVEDAATITSGYCFLAEHENVTGNKTIAAAYGAKSGSGEAFTALIDATGATLAETDTGTVVRLISFKGANGTTYHVIHDTDAATVLAVGT